MDHIILVSYLDNNIPQLEKKLAKDEVWKVAFTLHILWSGTAFKLRLQYCAGDQQNYYTSCCKNQETGRDPSVYF